MCAHHVLLRAVTNQRIKLFGHRWACMTNHSGPQIVIPFYVCDVRQPILSVTRLVEQGFQLTLDDNPRLQHTKGFSSTLENRDGLFFLQAEITTLPKGTKLQIHSTEQGQIGMIAPTTTLTPQGPADTGYAGDYWQFNAQGEPSITQCPVPAEQLEDYRRTTVRPKDGTTNTFEDKYQTMEEPNKAQQQIWKGETACRIKKGTTLPGTLQQQFATKTQPKSAPQKVTPQVTHSNPRTRLREKTTPPTVRDPAAAAHTQLDKDYHILQRYILEETTGTEKVLEESTCEASRSVLHNRAVTRGDYE